MSLIKKKWMILLGTSLAMMMCGIDYTIVNTTLANIQRDFNIPIHQAQWIIAAFGVTFSTLLVTMGRWGDIQGRRKILYCGIIGFGLTSFAAGMANSSLFLIIMRLLQGVFAACTYPTGIAITSDAFPVSQRGRALGIYNAILGMGMAAGPVIGSVIITLLNWRWIFFINIPIAVLSMSICLPVIKESKYTKQISTDWYGAMTLMVFLGPLTLAINQGPFYGWSSPLIIMLFAVALLGLICFFVAEKYVKNPLLPLNLFINRRFLEGVLIAFITVSSVWPVLFIVPLYLHSQLGFITGIVGLLMFPMTMMTILLPGMTGYWFDQHQDSKLFLMTPVLFIILGLITFLFLDTTTSIGLILIGFILFGVGWGFGNGIAIPRALSHLSTPEDQGLISGGCVTLFNLFGVVLLSIYVTIFQYGEKISFIHGMHMGFMFLLITVGLLGASILLLLIRRRHTDVQ